MIAVVTGASGFIGTHLVTALLEADAEVRVLRRPDSRPAPASQPHLALRSQVVDVLDADAVMRNDIWDGATHVFHLAGATRGVRTRDFTRANVQPTAHIARALARRSRPPRLVFVSSQAAAGATPTGVPARTEAMSAAPFEAYGRSKLEAELAAGQWREQLPITVLRPSAVYGPGDRDFLQAFKQVHRHTAWIAAAPRQALSLLYVRDLVACLLHVASHPAAVGQCWFVTHESPVTWPSLYEAMAAAVGRSPHLATVPSVLLRGAARCGDVMGFVTNRPPLLTSQKLALALAPSWVCSAGEVERVTGWRATTSLTAGLEETVRACRTAGWLPKAS